MNEIKDRLHRWVRLDQQPAPLPPDHPAQGDISAAADHIRDLETENERLRAALNRIIAAQERLGDDGYRPLEYRSHLNAAIDEARGILHRVEKGEGLRTDW